MLWYVIIIIKAALDNAKGKLSKNLTSTIKYLEYDSYREKYRVCCKNGTFSTYSPKYSNEITCLQFRVDKLDLLFAGEMTDCVGKFFDTKNHFSNHAGKGFAIFVFHKQLGMFAASHVVMHFHHSTFLAGLPVHFAGLPWRFCVVVVGLS